MTQNPKKDKRIKSGARAKGSGGMIRRARDTYARIRNLCIDLAENQGMGRGSQKGVDKITLKVEIPLRNGWKFLPSEPGNDLLRQILSQLEKHQNRGRFFRAGRVYCFRCDSLQCEHSHPPGSRSVFRSYSPTGTPEWQDFASFCLEQKDPRIDGLYEQPSEILALYLQGNRLKNEQLPIFGKNSKAYNILGELSFGLFPVYDPRTEQREYAAATLQAILSQSKSSKLSLQPNLLCFIPKMGDLNELLSLGSDHHLTVLFKDLKARFTQLENRLRRSPRGPQKGAPWEELSRKVETVFGQTGRKIERLYRQRRRRTRHAQARLEQKERPGTKAFRDAMEAPREKILYDRIGKTYIVLGPRGRVHAFTPAGRHVTSLNFQQEDIKRRREKGRWRDTSSEEGDTLLSALKRERT